LGEGGFLPSTQVADIIILAEEAPKVTMGEEDGSRATISDQRRLLPEMGKNTRDHQLTSRLAVAQLSLGSVNPTVPRTETAFGENFVEGANPFLQSVILTQFDIRRRIRH
jgi:hypothetical protein